MSADVAGYTRLMSADDVATIRTLHEYRERFSESARQHRGRVVDTTGDNLLVEFASVVEAVSCAIEVQRELARRNAELPAERRMAFRIGVHLGDVIVEGEQLYGDGVNLAARMQSLSEAGGICVSGAVHDEVVERLGLRVESLGERLLKNVSAPVRAYRLLIASSDAEGHSDASDPLTVPGFFGRPAIAVLAFDDLSPSRDQEHLADGLCEDLLMLLAAWRFFPVIARNSSFVYKGRSVDVKQVSRDLGVRYLVEGSVRRVGSQLRVAVQLIDATTGHHVWAKKYDREVSGLFEIQDEITQEIAASMHPELLEFESERAARETPPRFDAWELAQRGWWHVNRRTPADNARAQELLRQALALDARFGFAWYALAFSLSIDLFYQWSGNPGATLAGLYEIASGGAALDSRDPHAQLARAMGCSLTGRPQEALAAARRALELDPSFAWAHYLLATYLSASGEPEPALRSIRTAMRLSPQDPFTWIYLGAEASIHFVAASYERVVETCREVLRLRPDWPNAYAMLATSHAHLGELEPARAALAEMLRLQPGFTAAGFRLVYAAAAPGIVDRYIDGLRRAGLPPERC